MKRIGYLFEQVTGFENLYRAFQKAFSGSGRTRGACRFRFHLETEIHALGRALREKTYRPSPYRYFTITDPKERVISVAPFVDRVVHHALVNVLEPIFEPTFIFDSYATRKGKGTHRAVRRAQAFLRRETYFLKTDIAGFFHHIHHRVLLDRLAAKIKDTALMELAAVIIGNSDRSRGVAAGMGLSIGNLTSQFFANVYLNPLDHFIKEDLRVRRYIRYMDDMVFFSSDRSRLKQILPAVSTYLEERLQVSLKPEATLINSGLHGLPFLGFRVFPNLIRIRRENLKRCLCRLNRKRAEVAAGSLEEDDLAAGARSVYAHLLFADSLRLRCAINA